MIGGINVYWIGNMLIVCIGKCKKKANYKLECHGWSPTLNHTIYEFMEENLKVFKRVKVFISWDMRLWGFSFCSKFSIEGGSIA